jgi:hypothetical protein
LSTINPTWTALGANPGLRGEKPATNRLSYGTATEFALTHQSPSSNAEGENVLNFTSTLLFAFGAFLLAAPEKLLILDFSYG